MSKIVIALGGNALGKNPEEQMNLLKGVAKIIVSLVKNGEEIVKSKRIMERINKLTVDMQLISKNLRN